MTQISVAELGANTDKYVSMAMDQNIAITRDGKVVAKLVAEMERKELSKEEKVKAFERFLSLFPEGGLDLDPEKVKEERFREKYGLDL